MLRNYPTLLRITQNVLTVRNLVNRWVEYADFVWHKRLKMDELFHTFNNKTPFFYRQQT